MEDVWGLINKLSQESKEMPHSTGNSVLKDVYYQLPFFSCQNKFMSQEYQKDIGKYLYCQDTKTPPHPGSFGNIPAIWKEKHFLIKQAINILQQEKRDEKKKKHGR